VTPLLGTRRELLGAGRQPDASEKHERVGAIWASILGPDHLRDAEAVRADGLTSFAERKAVGVGHGGCPNVRKMRAGGAGQMPGVRTPVCVNQGSRGRRSQSTMGAARVRKDGGHPVALSEHQFAEAVGPGSRFSRMLIVRRMRRARPPCTRSPRRTLRLPDPVELAVVATSEVRAVVGGTHLLGGPGAARRLARPV
jgi:hypothetical protein